MISLSAELGLWARGQEGQQPELAGRGGQDAESQALSPTPQAPGGEGLEAQSSDSPGKSQKQRARL